MDLATIAELAQILGLVAILGGGVFALVQIRDARDQRRDAAALQVIHSLQTPEFSRAMYVVQGLPADLSPDQVRALGQTTVQSVETIIYAFETLGIMVHRRIVPLDLADEMIGGFVRLAWSRLRNYAATRREELKTNNSCEWFQWLAERLVENPTPSKAPGAHVYHRAWKP